MIETVLSTIADFSAFDIFLRIFFGAIIGLCLGLTGVGGGVLTIPVMRGFFAMSPVIAVGTASLCAAMMQFNVGLMHIRKGNVDWKKIVLVLCSAAPTLLITSKAIVLLSQDPARVELINQIVELLVILAIAFSLVSMINRSRKSKTDKEASNVSSGYSLKALFAGACTGAVIGATGVGGGILLLPLLSVTLGLDMKKAVGSSVVVALVLSSSSALTYSSGGQSDIATALLFVAGSCIGIPVAGLLLKSLSDKRLQQISLGLITISAMMMLRSILVS